MNNERYGTSVPNTPLTIDTEASISNFLREATHKIETGFYSTKEDLLKDIQNFDTLMNREKKDQNLEMGDYAKQIETLLGLFDEKSKDKGPDYSHLTEVRTVDGKVMSNLKTEDGNITLEQLDPNVSIQSEMNALYNETASKNLNEHIEDTVENNFELLQKHVKSEISFENGNGTNDHSYGNSIVTPEMDALQIYAEKNNILMEFTGDGLGRDIEGNIYKAYSGTDGQIMVQKTETTSFTGKEPVTNPAQTLEVMTEQDLKDHIAKMNQNSSLDRSYLDYLVASSYLGNGAYSKNYLTLLNESGLSDSIKALYKEAVEYQMFKENPDFIPEEPSKDTRMEQANTIEKPKVLVYTNPNTQSRGGFVNAFLLTIVTVLFGTLCIGYMFFEILG